MTPALRWAAMRVILMFHHLEITRRCPQTTTFQEKFLLFLWCFTSTESRRAERNQTEDPLHWRGKISGRSCRGSNPRPSDSEFCALLPPSFSFSVALCVQKPSGLLGTGSPGRPPRLSHSSRDLTGLHSKSNAKTKIHVH